MCIKNAMELSLKGDTFISMKEDFDAVLARTIGNMEMKGAEEATITLKLGVSLEKTTDYHGSNPNEVTKPSFKHDISSVMQVKDKKSGALTGDYCLVWDDEEKKYVMRRLVGDQMSMVDDEENVEYIDSVVSDEAEPIDPPALAEAPAENYEYEVIPVYVPESAFAWLEGFVGKQMSVTEAMGNYTVRTEEGNDIVLSSASDKDSVFHCDSAILEPHVDHMLACYCDGDETDGPITKIVVKCMECGEELYSLYNPMLIEDEVDGDTETVVEIIEDIPDYVYEDPEDVE